MTNKGKLWQKNSIYYILKNSIYTGTFIWNRQDRSLGGHKNKAKEELIRVENSHPALIDTDTFNRVQGLLEIRSPEITRPRTISSEYILGGIIYCGKCGATMQGCAAKSSKFHYYGCYNYLRRGKDICDAGLVSKGKLESFIIDRVKVNILTDDNLEKLVRLTNDELARSTDYFREQLDTVDRQLESLRERRNKLYDALETEKLNIDDVAPRLKELKSQVDKLEETRRELSDQIEGKKIEKLSINDIKAYAGDLKNLLTKAQS
jgi:site-specific DNA recombinase